MGLSAALLIGGTIAGAAAGGAFSKPKTPAAAVAPRPMPTVNDAAATQARRRALVEQVSRRGRQSTILTGESETLG